jgi:hypothetical protein
MDEDVGADHGVAHAQEIPDADPGPDADLPDARDDCVPPCGWRHVHLCGQVVDLESSQVITGAEATSLRVGFVLAKRLAADADTALDFTVHPDADGKFCATDADHDGLDVPDDDAMAVVVDDEATARRRTVTSISFYVDDPATRNIYSVRRDTEAAWSASAGRDLADGGVFAAIFVDILRPAVGPYPGTPRPSVRVVGPDFYPWIDRDYYFADASPLERHTLVSGLLTGENGTGLYTDGGYGQYCGRGPDGCSWEVPFAATVPGLVWVAELFGTCY